MQHFKKKRANVYVGIKFESINLPLSSVNTWLKKLSENTLCVCLLLLLKPLGMFVLVIIILYHRTET